MKATTDVLLFFLAMLLEGFLCGIYSGIFAIYLKCRTSKKDTGATQNIIFYAICSVYVLSVGAFVGDIALLPFPSLRLNPDYPRARKAIFLIQTTSFGCADSIAQFILIYRCWIVWGRNIRVVIVPSILTFLFLVTWLLCNDPVYTVSHNLVTPGWTEPIFISSLTLSLTVNALVTGLIVFRIFKVFREVKVTSDDQILGNTGRTKLRHIIFILIESGMTLFSVQLARLVLTLLPDDGIAQILLYFIIDIHEMLNGITPTIILVRISMGLSFYDEKSMEDAVGSLRFASSHPNSVSETETIDIVGQDSRNFDDTDIQ